MSALEPLLSAIRARATADTGASGIFQVGGVNKITGWYSLLGIQEATLPYVVVYSIGSVRVNAFDSTKYADDAAFQFSLYTDGELNLTVDQAIIDRIVSLFDRWAPTVAGFTASQLIHDGVNLIPQDNSIRHHAMDFRCVLSK